MPRSKDKDWADAFFAAFEDTHLVSEAAKRAGVHRTTVWRRRENDDDFRERWEDAEERSTEILEQIAVKRAAAGSDVLLMFLLKARRPNLYREHHRHEHTGPGGAPLGLRLELGAKERKALGDVLRGRPAVSDGD